MESHNAVKAQEEGLARGQLLFLPKDEEAYRGVKKEPDSNVKGHLVLILDIFRRCETSTQSSFVWALLISSLASPLFKKSNPRHIPFYDDPNLGRETVQEDKHQNCNEECSQLLHLDPLANMHKPSYLNATVVYELPLYCLQRLSHSPRRLMDKSFRLVRRLAAEAVWDALSETEIYCGPLASNLALRPRMMKVPAPTTTGLFAWVELKEGQLQDGKGNVIRKASGPCLVISMDVDANIAIVCLVIDREKPREQCLKNQDLNKLEPKKLSRLAAYTPRRPFVSLHTGPDLDLEYCWEPSEQKERRGFIPNRYIMVYPSFEVSIDELYGLPYSYVGSRRYLTERSLKHVNLWQEYYKKLAEQIELRTQIEELQAELKKLSKRRGPLGESDTTTRTVGKGAGQHAPISTSCSENSDL